MHTASNYQFDNSEVQWVQLIVSVQRWRYEWILWSSSWLVTAHCCHDYWCPTSYWQFKWLPIVVSFITKTLSLLVVYKIINLINPYAYRPLRMKGSLRCIKSGFSMFLSAILSLNSSTLCWYSHVLCVRFPRSSSQSPFATSYITLAPCYTYSLYPFQVNTIWIGVYLLFTVLTFKFSL